MVCGERVKADGRELNLVFSQYLQILSVLYYISTYSFPTIYFPTFAQQYINEDL